MSKRTNFYRRKLTKSQIENEGGFILEEEKEESEKNEILNKNVNKKEYENLACSFCKNMRINPEFYETFKIEVCNSCRYKNIKLITKTTCRKDFLMTEEELKYFKYILKPNPNKTSWVDMHLYLSNEIETFALNKFGSHEEIQKEKDLRKYNLLERKKKKIRKNVQNLRKKTLIEKKSDNAHKHKFVEKDGYFICSCGLIFEQEDL